MSPKVLDDSQLFTFKFWFNGRMHLGMNCQNELYCKLGSYDIQDRPRVYQLAHRLDQKGALVMITCSPTHCHLWGSLRGEWITALLTNPNHLRLAGSTLFISEPPTDNE